MDIVKVCSGPYLTKKKLGDRKPPPKTYLKLQNLYNCPYRASAVVEILLQVSNQDRNPDQHQNRMVAIDYSETYSTPQNFHTNSSTISRVISEIPTVASVLQWQKSLFVDPHRESHIYPSKYFIKIC